MSSSHELARVKADQHIDELLETEEGRAQFWAGLQESGSRDSMIAVLESTLHLPGDVIECGVYRGKSLFDISRLVSDLAPEKAIYGCDSFEGFPQDKVGRVDLGFLRFMHRVKKKFQMSEDTPGRLRSFFETYHVNGHVIKGFFSDTLGQFADSTFCFIHIDCDIYSGHLECLDALYGNLVPGGAIVFNDYGSAAWPGAKKAVDEFLANRPEKPILNTEHETPAWYIRKQA